LVNIGRVHSDIFRASTAHRPEMKLQTHSSPRVIWEEPHSH